jgi:hypothetical protein
MSLHEPPYYCGISELELTKISIPWFYHTQTFTTTTTKTTDLVTESDPYKHKDQLKQLNIMIP